MSPPPAEPPGACGVPALRRARPRDWLIGAALLAGLLIAVQQGVGWGVLLAPWREVSPWLLAGAFLLTAASYALRALRVYDWFGPLVAGRFIAVLRVSMLHTTANNLLPMRLGELVFPWLMHRHFGHGLLVSGVSLIWIRVMDLHCLALAGLLVLWLRAPGWWWPLLGLLWLALVPLGVLVRRGGWVERLPQERLRRLLLFVLEAAPGEVPLLARVYAWTLLIWATKLTAFALVLGHFVDAALWQRLAGVVGAELSSVLPFHGIAGAGSYELTGVAAMVPLGVEVAPALAGAVNLHLFLLGTTLLLGLVALLLPMGTAAGRGGRIGRRTG